MSNEVWKTGALSWSAINAGTASISNTDTITDGVIIYVEGIVNTSQKNVNYKVGVGGTTQFKDLPYKLPVYIEISADTNVSTYNFDVNGNVLVIRNTAATAKIITYAAGVTRSIPAGLTATMKYLGSWTDLINASGVRFPAIPIATSDPNTFNDYEIGTYVPTLTFGGGSTNITYGTRYGNYIKKGREITVDGYITLTSKGTSTGSAQIESLPLVAKANMLVPILLRTSLVTGTDMIQGYKPASNATIVLNNVNLSTGVISSLTDVNFSNTSTIAFYVSYQVA